MTSFSGSCLCGSVSYAIEGEAGKFYHCHCERCRKASGTGHCSNIILQQPKRAEWLTGEDNLSIYKVPGAKRFGTCFCKTCGSLMPRVAPDHSIVVIPAGTLDNEPDIQPQARIFWGSRSNWSCSESPVPTFSEYPV